MQYIFITIISLTLFINTADAQNTDTTITSGAKMTFTTSLVDYGIIAYNSNPYRTIEFTNTGTEPLIIANVKTSCGCLIASYPKTPIFPTKKGTIKLRYNTRRIGIFTKMVTIQSNAGIEILRIKGKVLNPPVTTPKEKEAVSNQE